MKRHILMTEFLAIQRARFVKEYGLFSNVIFKNNFILHIYESLENCLYSFLFGRTRSWLNQWKIALAEIYPFFALKSSPFNMACAVLQKFPLNALSTNPQIDDILNTQQNSLWLRSFVNELHKFEREDRFQIQKALQILWTKRERSRLTMRNEVLLWDNTSKNSLRIEYLCLAWRSNLVALLKCSKLNFGKTDDHSI